MVDSERNYFLPHNPGFQVRVGYQEIGRSPPLVARQTNTLLGLYQQGAIKNPQPARDYLHDYTLGYLKVAEEGSIVLYDRIDRLAAQEIGLEVREASSHAFVVMASLPDRARSPYLPKGFSRRGMLRAPATQAQFLERIKELKLGIWQIVEGEIEARTTLEAYPSALRVFKFFEVGSNLPIRLTNDETRQEQLERERFNDLLGGIDISL